MKKAKAFLAITISVIMMSGCSGNDTDAEIKIPILDGSENGSFRTAGTERYDVEEYTTVGAGVEYLFADTLTVPYSTNVLSYNVKKGDRLSAGDVIAEFDSADLQYDYNSQSIYASNKYEEWKRTGSELARLEYEQEAKKLELIQYKIDLCTVKAPYDCVVCSTEQRKVGEAVEAGASVCSVAKPNEVFITVKDNKELFSFGMPVSVKFGTSGTFSGKVAMMPEPGKKNAINSVVIRLDEGELERANEEAGSIASAGWGTVIVTDYRDYNVLCVPSEAVMQYSGETYCYIEDHGERLRIPVEAGKTINDVTVILSGLNDGDVVSY